MRHDPRADVSRKWSYCTINELQSVDMDVHVCTEIHGQPTWHTDIPYTDNRQMYWQILTADMNVLYDVSRLQLTTTRNHYDHQLHIRIMVIVIIRSRAVMMECCHPITYSILHSEDINWLESDRADVITMSASKHVDLYTKINLLYRNMHEARNCTWLHTKRNTAVHVDDRSATGTLVLWRHRYN